MMSKAQNLLESVKSGLKIFRDTDFSQVQYLSLGLALGAGLFILFLLILKFLWGRNKSKRPYSGHFIPAEYWRSKGSTIIYVFPKILLACSLALILWALANPYLPRTKIE